MATKTELQATINTKLPSASLIPAADHRFVEHELLNNFYGTEITETHETVGGITIPNTDFEYNVKITKQGGVVRITGFMENVTNFFKVSVLNIDENNLEYKPKDTILYSSTTSSLLNIGTGALYNNEISNVYLIKYTNNTYAIVFDSFIGGGEQGFFELEYNTEN